MKKVGISVTMDPEDIALQFTDQLREDDLFDLICSIDESVANYDFSRRLYEHFKAIVDEEDRIAKSYEDDE